ncbi:MAG TPA: cupin domain-containing protein [Ramlibacter sp.]|nr:cupin domain-containing protein [Ramlibacter sp.]
MSFESDIPDLAGREALWMGGRLLVVHHAPAAGATEPCVTESWLHVGQGPEEYRHRYVDFLYFLLEGHLTFNVEGRISELRPGTSLFVPRGTRHTYRVDGPTRARILIMGTPGQPWVDYVRAIGSPATAASMPPPDVRLVPMDYLKRVAVANGLEFTGPRLAGASRGGDA